MKRPGITWWEIALWCVCGVAVVRLYWLLLVLESHGH